VFIQNILLADENEYIDDSFVEVLSQKRFRQLIKKTFYRYDLIILIKYFAKESSLYYLLKSLHFNRTSVPTHRAHMTVKLSKDARLHGT